MPEKIAKSAAEYRGSRNGEQQKTKLGQYQHRDGHIAGTGIEKCIYCSSKDIVKRGTRKKKHGKVQLYFCKNCQRTFTPQKIKGKHYLRTVSDFMTTSPPAKC